jgi:hypothetical protein
MNKKLMKNDEMEEENIFPLSDYMKEKLKLLSTLMTNQNDWFEIKNAIFYMISNEERKKFSKRHKSTKKLFISDYDLLVIKYIESLTGKTLYINEERLHRSDEWTHKSHGWAVREANEKRWKDHVRKYPVKIK